MATINLISKTAYIGVNSGSATSDKRGEMKGVQRYVYTLSDNGNTVTINGRLEAYITFVRSYAGFNKGEYHQSDTSYIEVNGVKTYATAGGMYVPTSSSASNTYVAATNSVVITKTHSAQNISVHEWASDYMSFGSRTSTSTGVTEHYTYGYSITLFNEHAYGTITIPAKASYTISYNANGGANAPTAQTKWYGETLKLQTGTPTRTGFTFKGWSTSSTATSATYAAGANYTTNAAATLYAVWQRNTYAVTYNANGGSGASANQTKQYGINLTLTTGKPTRSGYTFVKWNTKSDGTGTSYSSGGTYSANAAVTLYAIWTANKFKITYNANGGTITDSPHAWVSNNNDTYLFKINLNNSIIQRTGANNTTYTDTWYSVSYNSAFNLTNYTSVNISRIGYHIDAATAWNTQADGSGTSYNQDTDYAWTTFGSLTTEITDITLYANWKPNPYPLNFNPNGGQCDTASKTVNYEQAYGTLPTPTRDGYTFDGWFTETSGGTQVSASTTMQTIDGTTVYAHWHPTTYYISYTLQGGTNHPNNPSSYNIEQTPFTLNTPTRNDYTFIGWTNNTYINPTLSVTIPEGSFGDYSFTANWHQNYFVPTLISQSFVVKRCDQNGNDADDGRYFYIEFSWQPGRSYTYTYNENNYAWEISDDTEVKPDRYDIIITDRLDPENNETYTIPINEDIDETTHTYNNTKVSQAFIPDFFEDNPNLQAFLVDEAKVYDVQLILYKDSTSASVIHPTETESSFISKAYFCIDINKNGTAIGFGTPVKDDDELDVSDEPDVGMHIDMNMTLRNERDFYIIVDESDLTDNFVKALSALNLI